MLESERHNFELILGRIQRIKDRSPRLTMYILDLDAPIWQIGVATQMGTRDEDYE